MTENPFDHRTMSEKKETLREGFEAMGITITPEQLDHWEYLKTATVSGKGSTEITVTADFLLATYQVISQIMHEMAALETETGKLPFDGSCSCPKHTWLMPVYNELTQLLNEKAVEKEDLSSEFKVGMDLMGKKQTAAFFANSERIGGPKLKSTAGKERE